MANPRYYQKRGWHLLLMLIAVIAIAVLLLSISYDWQTMTQFRRIVRIISVVIFSSVFYTHLTRYRHWRSPNEEDPI